MKKNGFTLVELLMTIVIMALIIAIAVPSINNITVAIRENQRNNIIDRILIASSKYAYDTGETIVFVDKLVTEGYIESDDDEGNIKDPVNNERMNCYVVEMEKAGDHYNSSFVEGKNYDNNGTCDSDKLAKDSASIKIKVYESNKEITNANKWIKGNITLKADSSSSNISIINCETSKCEWKSSSGANVTGKSEIMLDVSGVLNTRYTFQLTKYDDEDGIERYQSYLDLKVDNERPVINDNQIEITDKYTTTKSKKVVISASDNKGSGIGGYYLGISNGQNCESSQIKYQESKSFTVNQNGTYLICVKDKVGNTTTSELVINYIG